MGTLAPMPPLHGRQVEVAALDEALDRVASGRSAIVLIQGEAGIGKTRLLAGARQGDTERAPALRPGARDLRAAACYP